MVQNKTAPRLDTLGTTRDQYSNYKSRIGKKAVGDILTVLGAKFFPSTPRAHTGGAKVTLHSFLTWALNRSERSISRPSLLTSGKEGTH